MIRSPDNCLCRSVTLIAPLKKTRYSADLSYPAKRLSFVTGVNLQVVLGEGQSACC
jgi:hypothetical protein